MADSRLAFVQLDSAAASSSPTSRASSEEQDRMDDGTVTSSSTGLSLPRALSSSRQPSLSELPIDPRRLSGSSWNNQATLLVRAKSPTPRPSPTPSPTPSRPTTPKSFGSSHSVQHYPPSPGRSPGPRPPPRPAHQTILFPATFSPSEYGRRLSTTLTTPQTYIAPVKQSFDFVAHLDASLLAFLFFSSSFTISNKTLLRGFFPFPWILITVQLATATLGTFVAAKLGLYRSASLTPRNEMILKVVALLFSCEQLASLLSLRLVTVPFHLSVRALSPIATLALSMLFFNVKTTTRTASTFLLIIVGVVLTSHGREFHSFGTCLTFISALLSSAKSLVTTHLVQNTLHITPLDLVGRMSPLSMLHCAFFALLNGETGAFVKFLRGPDFTKGHVLAVGLNGLLSFSAIVAGLLAEKRTRAPSMAISGHATQAFTICVAAVVFGLPLSFTNFLGVAITLVGGATFAYFDAEDFPPPPLTLSPGKLLPD